MPQWIHSHLRPDFGTTTVIGTGTTTVLKILSVVSTGGLLAITDDSSVKVIGPAAGAVISSLDGHTGGTTGMCLTPDNEFLMTTGHDASVNVWSVVNFARIDNLKMHATKFGEGALCCEAAPVKCGKTCFTTGAAEGTVHIFMKS
jgi:WD40 repeat protein